jgi:hypothetical protein
MNLAAPHRSSCVPANEAAATLPVGVAEPQQVKGVVRGCKGCYFDAFIYAYQLRLKNVQCATLGRLDQALYIRRCQFDRDTARLVTGFGADLAIGSAAVTESLVFADDAAVLAEADAAALSTSYLTSIEEVIEHVKAADTLGFGFRVESYMVTPVDDPASAHPEFEFTLYAELPERLESATD